MLRMTVITVVLLGTTPTLGQVPAPLPSPVDVDSEVKRLYAEGAAAADRDQWETARSLFEQAFGLKPIPKIAANLGRAELMVGKPRAAAEHLEYFLVEEPGADTESRQAVEKVLNQARAEVGIVQLTVDPDGAEVFVNGESVGKSPFKRAIFLDPGSYEIEARAPGRASAIQKIGLGAGSKLDVALHLQAIEGRRQPPDKPAWRTPVMLGGIGLAAAGVGVGIGFSVAAMGKNDEMEAEAERLRGVTSREERICAGLDDPRCERLVDFGETRDTYRNVAIGGYVVGGLATVGTVIIGLASREPAKSIKPLTATIMVLPYPGGFNVIGTF